MTSDSMTFQPKFPWVDDERDTRAYITHDYPNKFETYIPTYVIMKQYYDEEKERIYGKDWNKISIWDYLQEDDEEWDYSIDYEASSSQRSDTDVDFDDECESELINEVSDNDSEQSSPTQPPVVSNKFWYS